MKNLGDLINEKRLEKKWTMTELAGKAGVTVMYISDIINEKRIPLTGEKFEGIARALDIDFDELKESALYTKMTHDLRRDDDVKINEAKLALARSIISSDLNEDILNKIKEVLK